jgi:hypothetical protein
MATTRTRPTVGGAPPNRTNRRRMLRRYGPFGVILAVVVVVALVTVLAGGDGDDESSGGAVKSEEQLIRSGPLTPAKADLLGRQVDFGPNCDEQTGRVAIPTVYAAPCVPPFEGNNGGSTYEGVTGDTIKVVAYVTDPEKNPLLATQVSSAGGDVSIETAQETIDGYVELYEQYYEQYGRNVELEYFVGSGNISDATAAKADAIAIAEKKPFAVLGGPAQVTPEFSDELAARGIMCLGNCALAVPEDFLKERLPYLWGIGPTPQQAGRLAAEAIGKQAAGGKAEYAGDPELRDRERRYGIVHYDAPDGRLTNYFETFESELEKHGIKAATDVSFFLELSRLQESARTIITKLKEADVTTVIYTGDPITPGPMTKEATAQEFFPEWILGPSVLADTTFFGRTYDQDQWKNGFGVSLIASRGEEETNDAFLLHEWFKGTPPPNNTYGVLWPDVNLLFNGIHLAGPELTPETFRDGLFRYPPSGGGPTNTHQSRGKHGIWPTTDWGGSDDVALIWWDPEAEGETENGVSGRGMYRYALGGRRYKLGELPSKAEGGVFEVASSVTVYDELPPGDEAPDYPSPAGG